MRCCYATYSPVPLKEQGIQVHDWVFGDGEAPPTHIVDAWLNLIDERFGNTTSDTTTTTPASSSTPACIATHCVAGLGR